MSEYFMGIDVGSLSTDGVLTNEKGEIVRSIVVPTGASIDKAVEKCKNELLSNPSVGEPRVIISTGYGRNRVPFAEPITEITAHALGALGQFPDTGTVIDIGGQDTKVIKISPQGGVADFVMNDRCAAGTGRFLEVMARLLEADLEQMAKMALSAKNILPISSTCTVFVESEVISLIAANEDLASVAAGIFHSIGMRVLSMVKTLGGGPPFTLTGGVAKNIAMVETLKKILPGKVQVPPDPQIIGAAGGAIFGLRKHSRTID